MTQYAELILPVPLEGTFTYRLPDGMAERVQVGMRVSAPLGKNHIYTGIVLALTDQCPEGVEVKDVIELLDEGPIVRPVQLQLWQWIADYYMCSIGDVMKAALPSELKPEEGKEGVVRVDFKPKMRPFVQIVMRDDLAQTFDQLKRSPRQQQLYMALLDRSHALQKSEPDLVAQDDLLRAAGTSTEILNMLVQKGLCQIVQQPVSRIETGQGQTVQPEPLHPLTEVQQVVYRQVCESFGQHGVTLLHGVTSSGKTELYMHLMQEVLADGRQVLMMVPEIALTTQLCQRLRRVLGQRLLVYHSKLSDTERVEIWKSLLADDGTSADSPGRVVLGVRSAVFLPFRQLGMIIVDEEHEPSYKQQDPAPRYHGRDVAMVLAHYHGAKVLLGSATPSLESWYLAGQGKYGVVHLLERHAGVSLPSIQLVSLTEARKEQGLQGLFSPRLIATLRNTLREGHQAILFQNRRGYSPIIECHNCGWTPRCPRCDVSLTYHKRTRMLTCHYCGYQTPWPAQCPLCGHAPLQLSGFGTERIEDVLQQVVPGARPVRMDTDTTASRRSYERMLADFESHKANVLIGTQMVSKGLDFSEVQTVGVLSADSLMNFPDFRAHERAFQLMEQVAGRAGRRAGQVGQVLIQCSNAQDRLLRQVVHHDYEGMAATQLADRQKYGFPPYTRLIMIYIKGRYEDRTRLLAEQYAATLRQAFGARVLGPEAPGVSRIKSFYIQQILLKMERDAPPAKVRQHLRQVHAAMMQCNNEMHKVVFYYDVDPM
ncbi:MAG: primosomal protein N' [Bacteroidales bacterium]|nr:primosomal protein N' [Bacteroidales bacterium]